MDKIKVTVPQGKEGGGRGGGKISLAFSPPTYTLGLFSLGVHFFFIIDQL